MSRPTLIRSTTGEAVQLAGPEDAGIVTLTTGAASTRGALPAIECFLVRLSCIADCYFKFGTSTVVASAADSHFSPRGSEVFKVTAGATHIAVIQHTASGAVSVSTMS